MADIELVIKIPERIHYGIEKGITVNGNQASQILIDVVKNGTPLPKGHGRLGDLDKLIRVMKVRDEDNGGEPLNAVDRGYHLAYEHLCEEIDNLLKENENADSN